MAGNLLTDDYKSRMHRLTFGYIRDLKLKCVISADIYDLCFDYFYAGQLFEFNETYDTNGIMYWLGTDYGKEGKWTSPVTRGLVELTCSTGTANIHELSEAIDRRRETRKDGPAFIGQNAWFAADFGDVIRVKPTHYTLEHGTVNNWFGIIRGWCFEGSNDGVNWELLDEQRHNDSIKYDHREHTFVVEDCSSYHRLFRVRLTGRQHHGHWELTASLVDIYGHMIREYS